MERKKVKIYCSGCKETSYRAVEREYIKEYGTYCDHCREYITFLKEGDDSFIFVSHSVSGKEKAPKLMKPF